MINIKVCYRDNGSVNSVLAQGHCKNEVQYAVNILMRSCGNELVGLKSAKIDKDDPDFILLSDIRQSKPAVAVVDALVYGLDFLKRKHPSSVSIMRLK